MVLRFLKGMLGQGKQVARGFQKILTASDILSSSDVTITDTNNFVRIGSYTVPAQTKVRFGYGLANQPYNQGYMYVKLVDDGAADEDGVLRLVQENATGTRKIVVWEGRTEELDGDANDKNKRIALPEKMEFPLVGEDSILALEFKADGADIIDVSACTVRIPVTVYQ